METVFCNITCWKIWQKQCRNQAEVFKPNTSASAEILTTLSHNLVHMSALTVHRHMSCTLQKTGVFENKMTWATRKKILLHRSLPLSPHTLVYLGHIMFGLTAVPLTGCMLLACRVKRRENTFVCTHTRRTFWEKCSHLELICHIFSRHRTSSSDDDLNTSLRCVNNVIFLAGGFFKNRFVPSGDFFFVFVFFTLYRKHAALLLYQFHRFFKLVKHIFCK